jgi:hypothetical protein
MSDDTLEPQDDAEVEGHKKALNEMPGDESEGEGRKLRNEMPGDGDEPEVEGHRMARG